MKPTTDIVEELRLYNRWRRGDEAITAPDPTALGKLIDDAADRIEHLFASGIHTCHADCQRPLCVMRRERDKAQNDLARVTAKLEQAEQRNAELEAALRDAFHRHIRSLAEAELARYGHPDFAGKLPAKHPDTERLDWLEGAPSERLAEVRRILWQQRNTCEATRAAIDAARKQEASK